MEQGSTLLSDRFSEPLWHIVKRDTAKAISFAEPQRTEFGIAYASGALEYRTEHWL